MEYLLFEPLKYYEQKAKAEHEQNANALFDTLVNTSKIDVEENRQTAKKYRKQAEIAEHVKDKLSKYKGWRIFLIILSVLSAIVGLVCASTLRGMEQWLIPVVCLVVFVTCLLVIFLALNKKIKHLNDIYLKEKESADQLYALAQNQMVPLNALFTERDAFNLVEKTLPCIKFNTNFSKSLSEDFTKNYDFHNFLGDDCSVIDTVSGRMFSNPFIFCRYTNHYIGTKVYQGAITITWRETYRDSNGNMRSRTRTQTLTATVSKPYPCYDYKNVLMYGHQNAPDLSFSRNAQHHERLNDKQIEKMVKRGEKKIQDKAEKSVGKGGNFTEMTNSEFDVLFGALDRDNEVQFRVMFTPLAQVNMVNLMRSNVGYGDDFSFKKRKRCNYVESEHSHNWKMNPVPMYYFSYDVDIARKNFVEFNNEYFRSIFFDVAPLMSVPAYQDEPSKVFEPLETFDYNYTSYEHEVLANAMDTEDLVPEGAVTNVIYKAKAVRKDNETDYVTINASSYVGIDRIDFVPRLGGDGRMHNVPVPWVEYLPVSKDSVIAVKEIGLNKQEFLSSAEKEGLSSILYDSPSAYMHGLFAKYIESGENRPLNDLLNKIKNK